MPRGSTIALRPLTIGCLTALFVLLAPLGVRAGENVDVEAKVVDAGVAVTASALVRAPFGVIWQTLTDYDHLAEFIPGMNTSRLIERTGTAAIVEQSGQAGNRLLSYPIDVVVESDEFPPSTISIRILSGNLRTLEGAYHLQTVAGARDEFILSWSGTIRPDFDLPDFIEEWAMRRNLREQFRGMLDEIERRGRTSNLS